MRLSLIDYSDAFSGIDDQMSGWITNTLINIASFLTEGVKPHVAHMNNL